MDVAIVGFHHVALFVVDLPRAEAFYTGTLGLRVLRRWPGGAGDGDRAVWLDLGAESFLALERVSTAAVSALASADAPGWNMVAVRIPAADRTAWVRRLTEAGLAVYRETAYTIYVRDPEGNCVGLSHWPDMAAGDGV